jgi:phosphoglycerate kinase
MKGLSDLVSGGLAGRSVLVRSDLNVPLEAGEITDAGRIEASVPTLRALAEAGARVVVTAHLGRPGGQPDLEHSLGPVAARLASLLGREVQLAQDVVGSSAATLAAALTDGDVLLLENVRFDPRETSGDDAERGALADALVALVSSAGTDPAFVSDGFGVVHRKQASVYDVATRLPAYAGGLVEAETEVLRRLTDDPVRPYAVVLGGSKVSDKIGVIEALAPKVDGLFIGGGMCFTFLAAQGHGVGDSLLQPEMLDTCRDLLSRFGDKIYLPVDVVVAEAFASDAPIRTVPANEIPDGWKGLDIGPATVERFAQGLGQARTIFWNGPMGVFEMAAFAGGTRGVAEAIAKVTEDEGAFSVVGGGDSAAAVRSLEIGEERFSHISTGGGASLEQLEGAVLPGLAVLENGAVS